VPQDKESRTKEILEAGGEIVGSATGAAAGLIFGGPAGAVGGAAIGPVVSRAIVHVCSQLSDRLSGRQKARVGAVVSYAAVFLKEKLESGAELRNKWILQGDPERSKTEEVLEGCLLKARDTYEEKKLKHMARLLANIPFIDISSELANQAIVMSEQLTYRQFCILSLAATFPRHLRKDNYVGIVLSHEHQFLLEEALDLHRRGLLGFYDSKEQKYLLFLDTQHMQPALMVPHLLLGETFVHLLGLRDIERTDLDSIEKMLAAPKALS